MSVNIDELVRVLDAELAEAITRHAVPGLAIGLCDAYETLWSAGFGTTVRGGGLPVASLTRFSVQSTSKLVTASTVLLAVQQSLVDLDEPIVTYLPEFTVNSVFDDDPRASITLRHLLSHTAGFTHEAPLGSNYDLGDGDFGAHCRSIFRTWLRFPVGHHYEYSNLGIDLAGYVLQRVSGMAFAEYARDALFDPLGMARSTFDASLVQADADRAVGHWRPFEKAGRPLPVAVPMVAAGGLYTTVADAVRFVRLHLRQGAPLIAPPLIAGQRQVPFRSAGQELGYGLGVYVDLWAPGVRVYHHGGSGFGFQAQLCWAPDLGMGVVIFTNSFDHSLPDEIARRIIGYLARGSAGTAKAAFPDPDLRPDEPGVCGPGDIEDVAGEYAGRLDDRVEVLAEGGRLLVRGTEVRTARVIGPRTIELDGAARERYRFTGPPGRPAAYMLALRDGQARYRNDADSTPESTLDPAREGTYAALSWGVPTAWYRLAQDGGSPVIRKLNDSSEPATAGIALRLTPIGPGLYISSTGEVLDLRSPAPTYANITLIKTGNAPDTTSAINDHLRPHGETDRT